MKYFILLLCIGLLTTCAYGGDSLAKDSVFSSLYQEILESKDKSFYKKIRESQNFESHIDLNNKYRTYLMHKVNFAPVNQVKSKIESEKNLVLKDRGEAHITVITPPEHDAIIAAGIKGFSMNAVEKDYASKIQSMDWSIRGIGVAKGHNFAGVYTEVYFLVVRSHQLRKLRVEVANKYKIPRKVFDPMKQDFHITIGFTVGDLFNIPKDETSLDPDLNLRNMVW
ncbi:MAG: hypothetical protein KC646_01510 [Candidatus Cloacimonetes bacterium]|nr:hypothetical protein [Candidatus Cloacimonadota bacterium]